MKIEKKDQSQQSSENSSSFSLKIGLAEVEVVAINPSKAQLMKLLAIPEDKQDNFKEKDYVGNTEEGDDKVSIDVYVKRVVDGQIFPVRFNIIDKVRVNKDGSKTQFINQIGATSWADDKANLPTFFTKFTEGKKDNLKVIGDKSFREAKVGEEELYTFLTKWLANVDWKKQPDIFLDFKKLMRGNVTELNNLIGNELTGTFLAPFTIREVEKDGETKQYQSIYNKAFLPAYKMKFVRNGKPESWTDYDLKKFKESMEYGCKDIFYLGEIEEYSAEKHKQYSANPVIDSSDSSY